MKRCRRRYQILVFSCRGFLHGCLQVPIQYQTYSCYIMRKCWLCMHSDRDEKGFWKGVIWKTTLASLPPSTRALQVNSYYQILCVHRYITNIPQNMHVCPQWMCRHHCDNGTSCSSKLTASKYLISHSAWLKTHIASSNMKCTFSRELCLTTTSIPKE